MHPERPKSELDQKVAKDFDFYHKEFKKYGFNMTMADAAYFRQVLRKCHQEGLWQLQVPLPGEEAVEQFFYDRYGLRASDYTDQVQKLLAEKNLDEDPFDISWKLLCKKAMEIRKEQEQI